MRIRTTVLVLPLLSIALGAQQPITPSAPAAASQSAPTCVEMATALTVLMRNDVRLRDWPNLARYRDANRELTAPAASEARVVFMGDSITDAWPQPRYGEFFVGKPYVGRGISGQTTPQMLIRFRPDVIALKPKVVVILAGTNDIAGNTGPMTNEEIQANLASMAELNEWIKQYAANEKHVYLDYFSAMVDSTGLLREELSADDLHPNAKGYAVMGPLAEAAIKQALR